MLRFRKFLFTLHLWVGVALCLALTPLALSGVVLQWPEAVNRLANPPPRVGAAPASLSPAAYLDAARAAVPANARLQSLHMPAAPGEPVTVTAGGARGGPPGRGGQTVWLDPVTAKVLKVGSPTSGLFRLSHEFHETLLIEGPGRQIVGVLGIAMLLLSLTGLWLWWPRGAFLRGFRWRRSPDTLMNLHHLAGFWIALPLALVSLTGIALSFPRQTAAVAGLFSGAGDQRPGGFGEPDRGERRAEGAERRFPGQEARPTAVRLSADEAAALAAAAHPQARLVSVTLPGVRQFGPPGAPLAGGPAGQAWRIEMAEGGKVLSLRVDDADGAVTAAPAGAPRPAIRGVQGVIRALHEGGGSLIWKVVVTLTGLVPLLLAVTGVATWIRLELRKRRAKAAA